MSDALIAALEANTAAALSLKETTDRLIELRTASIEEIKELAASAKGSTGRGAKKTDDKKTDEPSAATATAANATTTAAAADAAEHPLQGVQDICGKYLRGTDRTEERVARKERLAKLFTKAGSADGKLDGVPVAKASAVIKAVTTLIEEGDLTQPPAADAAAEEDDLLKDL